MENKQNYQPNNQQDQNIDFQKLSFLIDNHFFRTNSSGNKEIYIQGKWTELSSDSPRIEPYFFGNNGATATGNYLNISGGIIGSADVGYFIPRNKTIIEIAGCWNTDLSSGNLIIKRSGTTILTKAISGYAINETSLTTTFSQEGMLQVYLDSLSGSITSPSIIVFLQEN